HRREDREFERREMHRAAALPDGPALRLDLDVAEVQERRAAPRLATAKERPSSGDELGDAERLRHVVVGTLVQQTHLLALLVSDGEHEDRQRRAAPDLLDELESVDARHGEVGDDEVKFSVLEAIERLLAVDRADDFVPLPLECVAHDLADRGLVVGEEDAAHAAARGSVISNRAPPGSAATILRCPTFSSTRLRAIERPSPLPPSWPEAPSRTKRSKTRSRCSGGTPPPWSATRKCTWSASPATETRIVEPGGE